MRRTTYAPSATINVTRDANDAEINQTTVTAMPNKKSIENHYHCPNTYCGDVIREVFSLRAPYAYLGEAKRIVYYCNRCNDLFVFGLYGEGLLRLVEQRKERQYESPKNEPIDESRSIILSPKNVWAAIRGVRKVRYAK